MSPAPPEAIVNAPESAMLLVVKVWDPMTVPVIKVPTPALVILVVPLKDRSPAVIATLPEVTVSPPAVMVSPPEATVKPVSPVRLPPDDRIAVGVLIKLVYPVAERKFKPWVASDPPKAPPASKVRRFRVLVAEVGVEVLVGVRSNPETVVPALAVLVFWKDRTWALPPELPG
jgi:hypothetical protein